METLRNCPVCEHVEFDLWLECEDHFLSHEKFQIVQCKNCGFRFVNPRPEAADLGKYYQSEDYISHKIHPENAWDRLYKTIRNFTIKKKYQLIHRYKPNGSLLDIGCATGEVLNYFKLKNWDVLGIEPEESARKQAEDNYGIRVYDEPYLDQIAPRSFDVITMWHVLEHVSDLNRRMQDLNRLIKNDGIIIFALPNSNSKDAKHYGRFWAAYDVPRHLYHFTMETVSRLLENHNLFIQEKIPMKFDSYYVSMLSEKYISGKKNWIKGTWYGMVSNLVATKKSGYSSMIYVIRRKNALESL